jgi:2-oxoglutarate ferredoxin oxidoreductase subunit alpha
MNAPETKELEHVVIRFSGDSGDGMQITGTQFSQTSAFMGNALVTFPDYPSEIRAPHGTIAGVSGFQIHFGSMEIESSGDDPNMLVAMNPAALKANIDSLKAGGAIIVNLDAFTEANLAKAGYSALPFDEIQAKGFQLIKINITEQTLAALKDLDLDRKSKERCKNFYALGMTYFIFSRDPSVTIHWIEEKFAKNPVIMEANIRALRAGNSFAETTETIVSTYKVASAHLAPGTYRQVSGNVGTALGLLHASKAAGLNLFLGSYPITPATEILQELSHLKEFGVKTLQAEDEIAGICSAIGASYGGALGVTTTSGPGLCLKTEAIGLATIYEIPLVIVDVQRGGPSTGLPTKTEQADLFLALFGRNGEAPVPVLAASRPNDCFAMAYEAARIALEHMTPVILLTDGYIANGVEPWKVPNLAKEFPRIQTRLVDPSKPPRGGKFLPYDRDPETCVRPWAVPGMIGYEHKIGGLEKADITGCVSHDPANHQKMVELRQKKIDLIAGKIPPLKVKGDEHGELLVLSWGGVYGPVKAAITEAKGLGMKVSHAHLKYLNPMPANTAEVLSRFKNILIPELNMGQLNFVIRARYGVKPIGLNKIQGQPFKVREVLEAIKNILA